MEWFRNFMLGRRGPDQLTLALLIIYWPFSLLGRITGFSFLDTLALICLAVAVFRVFSKDLPRRERENLFFLKYWNKAASWLKNHRLTAEKKRRIPAPPKPPPKPPATPDTSISPALIAVRACEYPG